MLGLQTAEIQIKNTLERVGRGLLAFSGGKDTFSASWHPLLKGSRVPDKLQPGWTSFLGSGPPCSERVSLIDIGPQSTPTAPPPVLRRGNCQAAGVSPRAGRKTAMAGNLGPVMRMYGRLGSMERTKVSVHGHNVFLSSGCGAPFAPSSRVERGHFPGHFAWRFNAAGNLPMISSAGRNCGISRSTSARWSSGIAARPATRSSGAFWANRRACCSLVKKPKCAKTCCRARHGQCRRCRSRFRWVASDKLR